MSALALAILLTGAGAPGEAQRGHEPPGPPVTAPVPPTMTPSMAPMMPPPMPPRPSQARPARAYLVAYFTTDRYPVAALRANEQGLVSFRVEIDPRGAVTGCTITVSSGSVALDEGTCAILREARYIPARDEAGRPTSGTDAGRVNWRLPDE